MNIMPLQTDIEDIANVEQQIEQHAQNVERIQGNAILEIGRELKFAQDLFRFNRNEGGFTGWLATRLPHINQRAAYRAIQRYEGVEEFDEFVKLSGAALDEVVKAEPDIQAIIAERVEAGEVFTAAQVKELKQKAAQEAVDRLNSEADQARKDLEELKKSATDRDIRSASEVRDLQQKISDLTAKIGELKSPPRITRNPSRRRLRQRNRQRPQEWLRSRVTGNITLVHPRTKSAPATHF
ncbi:hypothetical protein HED54_14710 [Ochrobactrum anthropi ATCC 49188]|nr:hypothetical protein [Brucella anthropi ATCC 49188]